MRDERGRYQAVKDISSNGPAHARGCPKCTFGIVSAPDLTNAAPLYMERMVQAVDGDITFCSCQAGQHYRTSLLKRHKAIMEQDERDSRILVHKVAGSEQTLTPENTLRIASALDIARNAIYAARERNIPSIHFESESDGQPTPDDALRDRAGESRTDVRVYS